MTLGLSRTSIMVAAARAVGAREPDPSIRNPDYLAERLLGAEVLMDVDLPVVHALDRDYDEAMRDPEVAGPVVMMMVRTRFIDERLEQALRDGAAQMVILGAGFDSRAYRFAESLKHVRVFEVDRAVMQEIKRRRIDEILGGRPPNLKYVPIDFQQESLSQALERAGLERGLMTFFIAEGLTMYLPGETVRDGLRFVAALGSGSRIVFDYVNAGVIEFLKLFDPNQLPEPARGFMQRMKDLMRGEPWIFGIPAGGEEAFLKEVGLDLRQVLPIGGEESIRRYATRADGSNLINMSARPAPGGPPPSAYYLMEASSSLV